jgi:hypothetical protein
MGMPICFEPRLQGVNSARTSGYNDRNVQTVLRGIEFVEKRLVQLFGAPLLSRAKLKEIRFVAGDKRLGSAGIGLERGQNLFIDCVKFKPVDFKARLVHDLTHEYAHALTVNRDVLWESMTPHEQRRVESEGCLRVRSASDLYRQPDRAVMMIFMAALGSGLNNPYVSGLKIAGFDIGRIKCSFHNHALTDEMTDKYIGCAHELIAERMAELIVKRPPAFNALIRGDLRQTAQFLKTSIKSGEEWLYYSADALYARIYAEKTGNADLLNGIEENNFDQNYAELYPVLSALWDQIGLKAAPSSL